jgi:HlyD family secretion protein
MRDIAGRTDGRGVSGQDLDRAARDATAAQARADEQAQALRLARIGPREEEIAGARAQVASAQAQLALLQHQIDQGIWSRPRTASSGRDCFSPAIRQRPRNLCSTLHSPTPNGCASMCPNPTLAAFAWGFPPK